jgi:myosin-crossreactive antigen
VVDEKYNQGPFKVDDISNNTLITVRRKKEKNYEEIVQEAKAWLERNKEEIAIKYKVSKIEVDFNCIIISNLGMVPKSTEVDLCRL